MLRPFLRRLRRLRFNRESRSAGRRPKFEQPPQIDPEVPKKLQAWFERYLALPDVIAPETVDGYTCPCCGHRTLGSRGNYEICPECDWEGDGQDDHDADLVRGGPNGRLSLTAARDA